MTNASEETRNAPHEAAQLAAVKKAADLNARQWGRRWMRISIRTMMLLILVSALILTRFAGKNRDKVDLESRIVPTAWDVQTGENVKWQVQLGAQTYGTPVVSGGRVFIGTGNHAGYVKRLGKVDMGVLICFRESDGKFLWQSSSPKLKSGRVHDWPEQGVCSTPLVEGERLWYVNNRAEVVCLDTLGFHDNENDGPYSAETVEDSWEADVVWKLDMMSKLGVQPHNMSACSVVSAGQRLFVVTGNGVGVGHLNVQSPRAPSFLCLDKRTGAVLWADGSPGNNVLHGQWGSPLYGVFGRVPQVIFPGGDGWLYSFDPRGQRGKSKLLWRFDCNPKKSKWVLGGRGTRNNLLRAPVAYKGRIYMAVGQDPEHGEGDGHLWCIDPTRQGDVSPQLVFSKSNPNVVKSPGRLVACDPAKGDSLQPNPNSAVIWHYQGQDLNKNGTLEFTETFHRSLNSVAIQDDLLVAVDFSGLVHCVDANSGKAYWTHDLLAAAWSAPLIAGQHIYVADEDGMVSIFKLSADSKIAMNSGKPLAQIEMPSSNYGSPVAANNTLFIPLRDQLFAIKKKVDPAKAAGKPQQAQ